MAKSAKCRLHSMLKSRGIAIPEYQHDSRHVGGSVKNTSKISLTLEKTAYHAEGVGGKYAEADEQAAAQMLQKVMGHLRRLPQQITLNKGRGSWEELYKAGEYASALKRYCLINELGEPFVEHKTCKERLFTGGKSAGRMGSVGKKKHEIEVSVGEIKRSAKHPQERLALLNASKSVMDELIRTTSKEARHAEQDQTKAVAQ